METATDKLAEELDQNPAVTVLRAFTTGVESNEYWPEAAKRLKVINLEKVLVRAKSSLHSMNIALRAKHTTVAAATNAVTDISAAKEDKIELIDLLPIILEHHSSGRKVVFAGTDPGIVTTSTTIPRTLEEVFADINRFHILSTEDGSNVETTLYSDGVQ
ncbi:LOW QUALITY PROTEIN: hypothetical protein BC938DRAFT_478292 [Jimgerdemannia flammicorona]|uniref:Uncharacterized protein n=1 Tax=Jimgerdemannia flammicorona TaxID=994334 RepID=A0A433P5U8_9FUNG|nr:LOW QUALITY PROTEIN: hypothetical protein BC938DRAFT_478292 [Jimgerdemannia flammicorona]